MKHKSEKQSRAGTPKVPDNTRKIGYARVSTQDQNLDLQIDALVRDGVRREDIHVEKKSAKAGTKRPCLVAAFKDLREGDVLVVWKLDRLGRSIVELIHTVETIRQKGAELRVITMNIDTSTAAGKMIFHMFAAFAEFERDLIGERTKAGQAAARARGRVPGRRPVLTPEKEKQARVLLSKGVAPVIVAKQLKVSKTTIYNYLPNLKPEKVHDPIKNKMTTLTRRAA